jgi:hypothetical protein
LNFNLFFTFLSNLWQPITHPQEVLNVCKLRYRYIVAISSVLKCSWVLLMIYKATIDAIRSNLKYFILTNNRPSIYLSVFNFKCDSDYITYIFPNCILTAIQCKSWITTSFAGVCWVELIPRDIETFFNRFGLSFYHTHDGLG